VALDPVCGMTVEPATAAGSAERHGKTYWFCSQHCLQVFLGKHPAALAPEGGTYTCPMHPEIAQMGPGSCP